MRILYINHLDRLDGSTIHVNCFTKALQDQGNTVHCLWHKERSTSAYMSPKKNLLKDLVLSPIKPVLAEIKMLLQNIPFALKEYRLLTSGKYDVVILRYSLNMFSAVLLGMVYRIPVIIEANSPLFYEQIQLGRKLTSASKIIERWILNNATAVVTVSNELKDFFSEHGICPSRFEVVFNGVDTSEFYPREKDPQLLAKYGIPQDSVVVGFSGSFQEWHGVDLTLEIEEILKKSSCNKKFHFLLVGDGMRRKLIEQQICERGLNNFTLCGRVQHAEMPAHLSLFDIALAPYPKMSNFYFSPLKIYEYMAMGIPTVASRMGQINQIIVDSKTGLLVDAGDRNAFAQAILDLTQSPDLRATIARNAAEVARSEMGWNKTARKYITIAESLQGSSR